jgi:hypothetical protein
MSMNPPSYSLLRRHMPDPMSVPAEELWRWIGHADKLRDPAWHNTCAVRMSLALAGAGVFLSQGFLVVRAGKYKGRRLEVKQEVLANHLAGLWGEPERFGAALLRERLTGRRGVIRFVGLWGPYDPQGHIDLISAERSNAVMCEGGHIYWHAVECWFWECPL